MGSEALLCLTVNLPVEVQVLKLEETGKRELFPHRRSRENVTTMQHGNESKGGWKDSSILEKDLRHTDISSCQMLSLGLRIDWPNRVRTEVGVGGTYLPAIFQHYQFF